jgi:hypothetical protein
MLPSLIRVGPEKMSPHVAGCEANSFPSSAAPASLSLENERGMIFMGVYAT